MIKRNGFGDFQPACRRQNKIHAYIVSRRRNLLDDLLIEGDPAFGPGNPGQQTIVESLAPAQPASRHIES
jgi:hypothetical protein